MSNPTPSVPPALASRAPETLPPEGPTLAGDKIVATSDGVLSADAVDRLAVHLARLTDHQIGHGQIWRAQAQHVEAALAAKAARDRAWAEFWGACRTIPEALLVLLRNKYAAPIYAIASSIGGLHWLGVSPESLALVLQAFRGLVGLGGG